VHQSKLARMVELEARYAFAARQDGRFSEFAQLAAVDECLKDILLNVLAVVING
jgi:hypothetical protein